MAKNQKALYISLQKVLIVNTNNQSESMAEGVVARVPSEIKKEIEFFAKQEQTDKSSIIRKLLTSAIKQKRLEYALNEYAQRKVSLGKAAELARMCISDFMMIAAERKIPINYSVESLEKDFKAALKAK